MTIKEAHSQILEDLLEELKGFDDSDLLEFFNSLTIDKAIKYGFRKFSNENPLYLIPGCFHDFLPKGLKLRCISGRDCVVGKDYIDDDTRYGLLAYGIYLEK